MSLIGKTIGNFRVTDLVGKGGMGEVYVAFDERLKRKVALKTIRGERRFNERNKARLLREAELLSKLEHPNICRIYDLLETEDADVLVLELIKGQTLNKIPIRDLAHSRRLRIAIQLGIALADAHAHSVVHRDLKPENVMIDDRGDVKVLDFGLAHSFHGEETVLLQRSEGDETVSRGETVSVDSSPDTGFKTEQGHIVGTPMYMSLEQARGLPVTAASDMYSYGLLLQWLFTGSSPYPAGLSAAEIFVRAGERDTLPAVGVQEELRKLIERLKSIDPSRRPTAVDAVELLKAIDEAPRRKARRLAAAGFIGILIAGIFVTGLSLYRAKKAERLERVAHERSEKMSSFLVDMWVSPSPMERGRDVKVVDVLAYGKDKVEQDFHDDPVARTTLLTHLATTYRRLGEYARAEEIITECLEDCRRTLGPDHPNSISAMIELGVLYSYDERFPEAETLFRDALESEYGRRNEQSELMIYAKVMFAEILIRKAELPQAKILLEEALTVIRGSEALQHKFGPKALLGLGNILDHEENYPAAARIFLELVESYEERENTENLNYVAAMGSLARVLMVQGRHGAGLRYMRRSLDLSTRINGEYVRAILLAKSGRKREAKSMIHAVIAKSTEALGADRDITLECRDLLGRLLCEEGDGEGAEKIHREVLQLRVDTHGTDNAQAANTSFHLAKSLQLQGRATESCRYAEQALRTRFEIYGGDHRYTNETVSLLVAVFGAAGRADGADSLLGSLGLRD